jgi:hypothetical protein
MTLARRFAAALVLSVLVLHPAGCKKKSAGGGSAPEVSGLGAVPVSADVVLSFDVPSIANAPLVQQAAAKLLLRDAGLASRWERLRTACKLDPLAMKQVVLALGPVSAKAQGSAAPLTAAPDAGKAVLMVVTGPLVESEFASCVRSMVGSGGGSLNAKTVAGRTIYEAKEGVRAVWFGFGKADTVVLGSTESYVAEALGSGPKITNNPDFSAWLAMIGNGSPLWAIGRVDQRVGEGLIKATNGKVAAGPRAILLKADLKAGVKVDLQVQMSTAADAKELESFVDAQMVLLQMAAQWKKLGPLAAKLEASLRGTSVTFVADWTMDDLNQLLSVIDSAAPADETAPPSPAAPGAGN